MVTKKRKTVFNWREYFLEFSRINGGDPVMYRGRQLFRTGWMYSASDYAGPEWKPDEKEIKTLQRAYWHRRKSNLHGELKAATRHLEFMEDMQLQKSVPLQCRSTVIGDDGRKKRQTSPVDLESLRSEVALLESEIADCDQHLKELNDGNQRANASRSDLDEPAKSITR